MTIERTISQAVICPLPRAITRRSTRRIRQHHGLAAENATHANLFAFAWRAMRLAQAVAHLGQQGVMGGAAQVVNVHQMGVALATGCAN